MRTKVRRWLVGGTLTVMVVSLTMATVNSADDNKAVRDGVLNISALIQKGKVEEAKAAAKTLAKNVDMDVLMELFKVRKKDGKGGIGLGSKPGAAKPDGIESYLQQMEKKSPTYLAKDAAAIAEAAHVTAAIALVTEVAVPADADSGKKKKKDWLQWSQDQYSLSLKLAEAAKAKDGAAIKKLGMKLDATCTACHDVFKE